MGCAGSKAEDSPLVARCRQRRELIRAAVNYRYSLAAAHLCYFRSLKDVGDALRKFVAEELALSSSVSSPNLILPATLKIENDDNVNEFCLRHDEGEVDSHLNFSNSSSDDDGDFEDHDFGHDHHHHLRHSFDSDSDEQKGKDFDNEVNLHDEAESSSHHPRSIVSGYDHSFDNRVINDRYVEPFSYSYPQPRAFGEPFIDRWYQPGGQQLPYASNSNVYYMKKLGPEIRTVIQEPPTEPTYHHSLSYWNSPAGYGNSGYDDNYGYFNWGAPATIGNDYSVKVSKEKEAPPPSPKASGWDFFNPFEVSDNRYLSYYSNGRHGHGSNTSSPDSNELREREGIPDLEEDTETEASKDFLKGKRMKAEVRNRSRASIPHSKAVSMRKNSDLNSAQTRENVGSSRPVPLHKTEDHSISVTSWSSDESEKLSLPSRHTVENEKQYLKEILKPSPSPSPSPPFQERTSWVCHSQSFGISLSDEKSSPEIYVSKIVDENSMKKKGVSFEVEDASNQYPDSSMLSGVTPLSLHGNRDLREVVAEIRDDFEVASGFGKEVAMMLEVGKVSHQPSFLKVILSQIICHNAPSMSIQDASSIQSVKLTLGTTKLTTTYFEDVGKDVNTKSCSLSSTLDKLLAWEKKLYKEVKDEERIRVKYEKQCKRLKSLDERGSETTKLDAAQASIRRLRTKLDVSIKAIDGISSRIHELRDEELQPQVAALIHGLIRMWKAMLKFHQKQFQAIMESKTRKLANAGLQTDLSSRASTVLERELGLWCGHFCDWIGFQKIFVESLNKWLLSCLQYEPEETPDGPVPYSPGQLGAPPIFVICNDWHQAMKAISEARVASAVNTFATILRQLGEKQDEEGRQRLKAEYLSKDYEKPLGTHHFDGEKPEHEHDAMSEKTGLSLVPSDNGVSPLNDPKVDLNSIRHELAEERVDHEDAVKLVHDAAASSLQSGLVPIFQALESFTSEALKLHEHVRLQLHGQSGA